MRKVRGFTLSALAFLLAVIVVRGEDRKALSDSDSFIQQILAEEVSTENYSEEQANRILALVEKVEETWEYERADRRLAFVQFLQDNRDFMKKAVDSNRSLMLKHPETGKTFKLRLSESNEIEQELIQAVSQLAEESASSGENSDLIDGKTSEADPDGAIGGKEKYHTGDEDYEDYENYEEDEELDRIEDIHFDAEKALHGGKKDDAVRLYRKAADEGHSGATTTLAMMYLSGFSKRLRQDFKEGAKLLRRALKMGNADAQATAAMLHSSGLVHQEFAFDKSRELLYLATSAGSDSMIGLAALGFRQYFGIDVEESCYKAAENYFRAAEIEVLPDANEIKFIREKMLDMEPKYLDDDMSNMYWDNQIELFHLMKGRAEQGEYDFMFKVAGIMIHGTEGIPRDRRTAARYLRTAAANGHSAAKSRLGYLYYTGVDDIIQPNNATAFNCFSEARNEPHNEDTEDYFAAFALGVCYANGIHVERNMTEAEKYFREAKKLGCAEADYSLGLLALQQNGREKTTHATMLFTEAGQKGHLYAVYQLARLKYKNNRQCGEAVQLLKTMVEHMLLSDSLNEAVDAYMRRDYNRALYRFLQAAFMGSSIGQYNAALMIQRLQGSRGAFVGREKEMALKYYKLAEKQNLGRASLKIGDMMYSTGDYQQSLQAYQKVASLKHTKKPEAIFNVGLMYFIGKGAPMDYHLAKRNFDKLIDEKDAFLPASIALSALSLCMERKNLCTFLVDLYDYVLGEIGLAARANKPDPQDLLDTIQGQLYKNPVLWKGVKYLDLILAAHLMILLAVVLIIRRRGARTRARGGLHED